MYLEQPIFGYGFIPNSSNYAVELGHDGDGLYSLYYFDFGYMSLLNMFGLFGFIFFVVNLYILLNKTRSNTLVSFKNNIYLQAVFAFVISFLIVNYSFGSFTSNIGLLPLGVMIGLAQGNLLIRVE
jgi:hypothetical protein